MKCQFFHETGHPRSLCRKQNICSYCKTACHNIVDYRAPGQKNFGNARSSTSYATQGLVATETQAETSPGPPSIGSLTYILKLVHNELVGLLPQALNSTFSLGITEEDVGGGPSALSGANLVSRNRREVENGEATNGDEWGGTSSVALGPLWSKEEAQTNAGGVSGHKLTREEG
ncbi:hypothetical protein LINPERPRIM_LOCUS21186 [Linum perenne]